MLNEKTMKFDEYTVRLVKVDDVGVYYKCGFENPDEESNHYTGTTTIFSKEQIRQYIEKIVADDTRYDFIIWSEDEIVGEVVLSDVETSSAYYRIGIFHKKNFSKGIGYKATVLVLEFAFDELGLESVDLEVFPFNERGIGLYKKLGFEIEKKIVDDEADAPYRDILVMRLLKDNFIKS